MAFLIGRFKLKDFHNYSFVDVVITRFSVFHLLDLSIDYIKNNKNLRKTVEPFVYLVPMGRGCNNTTKPKEK